MVSKSMLARWRSWPIRWRQRDHQPITGQLESITLKTNLKGLRIAPPEAPVTGYMFGKGIYFADMVSKSANYCHASYENPRGLALLAEVALGKMHECKGAEYIEKLPTGFHSCKGLGGTEPNPKDDLVLENGCKGTNSLL